MNGPWGSCTEWVAELTRKGLRDKAVYMPMPQEPLTVPKPQIVPDAIPRTTRAPGFLVICWNDPVNLMQYVTHVFQVVFGWEKKRADKHMLEVHELGKSILVREDFEKAESYVHQLQGYGLTATLEKDADPS